MKFKKGDVVIVKENTTLGFRAGTLCRIVKVSSNSEDYKSYLVKELDGNQKRFHDEIDLRKVKGWDK